MTATRDMTILDVTREMRALGYWNAAEAWQEEANGASSWNAHAAIVAQARISLQDMRAAVATREARIAELRAAKVTEARGWGGVF